MKLWHSGKLEFQSLKGFTVDFRVTLYILLAIAWAFQSLKGFTVDFRFTTPTQTVIREGFNP